MAGLTIGIEVDVNDVLKRFNTKQVRISKGVDTAIKKSIFQIERNAKLSVTSFGAVDTGRLRASIGGGTFRGGSFPTGEGIIFTEFKGQIGPTVDYAIYVHEGTDVMRARPFMTVAEKKSLPFIRKAFTNEINKALR